MSIATKATEIVDLIADRRVFEMRENQGLHWHQAREELISSVEALLREIIDSYDYENDRPD